MHDPRPTGSPLLLTPFLRALRPPLRSSPPPPTHGWSPRPGAIGAKPGACVEEAARLTSEGVVLVSPRGGPTRSLPEHGRETPLRQRYCVGNCVGQSVVARSFPRSLFSLDTQVSSRVTYEVGEASGPQRTS